MAAITDSRREYIVEGMRTPPLLLDIQLWAAQILPHEDGDAICFVATQPIITTLFFRVTLSPYGRTGGRWHVDLVHPIQPLRCTETLREQKRLKAALHTAIESAVRQKIGSHCTIVVFPLDVIEF